MLWQKIYFLYISSYRLFEISNSENRRICFFRLYSLPLVDGYIVSPPSLFNHCVTSPFDCSFLFFFYFITLLLCFQQYTLNTSIRRCRCWVDQRNRMLIVFRLMTLKKIVSNNLGAILCLFENFEFYLPHIHNIILHIDFGYVYVVKKGAN